MYFGLLLFFVLDYIRPTSYIPALLPLHLNSIIPLTVSLGSFFKNHPVSNQEMVAEPISILLGCFYALIGVSVITADVTQYAYSTLTVVTGYVLIYIAIIKLATDLRRIKGVMATLVLVHFAVAVLNPQIFTPDTRAYLSSGVFLGDGNDFALSIDIVIPLCLFFLFESPIRYRPIYLAILVLLVVSVVATQSRGGTIGLAFVAAYFWAKMDRKIVIGVLAAAAVAGVLLMAPPAYFNRMSAISTQEESAQGRIYAWTAAVQMAVDHPMFGVGAGNFPTSYGAFYLPPNGIGQATAHSIYFLALGELGLPGIVVLVAIIATNLVANRRLALELRQRGLEKDATEIRLLASMSAALIAFATAGAFLSALYYPHLYVLAGMLTAARGVVRRSAQREVTQPAARKDHIHWALRPRGSTFDHGSRALPAR